jgi:hypothetical protein
MVVRREVYRIWVRKPEGIRPLGRPRHRCEDNNKWIFRSEIWWYAMDYIGLG